MNELSDERLQQRTPVFPEHAHRKSFIVQSLLFVPLTLCTRNSTYLHFCVVFLLQFLCCVDVRLTI